MKHDIAGGKGRDGHNGGVCQLTATYGVRRRWKATARSGLEVRPGLRVGLGPYGAGCGSNYLIVKSRLT